VLAAAASDEQRPAHEPKDVDIAVWLDAATGLARLRVRRSRAVNQLWEEKEIGVAHHQVDVFLLDAAGTYLGRLCCFNECPKHGYIVIAPAAPDGQLFFEDGARIFPDSLKTMLADYKIQGDKCHVAGPSNGGIAAFHVAAAHPRYSLSVTAFPGYMWQPSAARLQAMSKMCVFMDVGEMDQYMWHGEMKQEGELLRSTGAVARYTVEKGQPHRLDTLTGANAGRLFDGFEETKKGCSR